MIDYTYLRWEEEDGKEVAPAHHPILHQCCHFTIFSTNSCELHLEPRATQVCCSRTAQDTTSQGSIHPDDLVGGGGFGVVW